MPQMQILQRRARAWPWLVWAGRLVLLLGTFLPWPLAFAAPISRVVQFYALTSANDFPQRDPRDWRLLGSTDGGRSWVVLDSRKGELFGSRHERRLFQVARPAAYQTYRLQVDRVRDPAAADSVQLAEIEPLGSSETDTDPVPEFEDTVTAQGDNQPLETKLQAFDGRVETKWLDHAANYPASRASWIQWQYQSEAETVITNIERLLSLRTRAAKGYPVRFEAVLAGRLAGTAWCLLDHTGAVEIPEPTNNSSLQAGQRILLTAKSGWNGKRVIVTDCAAQTLGPGPAAPIAIRTSEAIGDREELFLAQAQGTIEFCSSRGDRLLLDLETDDGTLPVCVLYPGTGTNVDLLGAFVQIEGLCESVLNERGQRVPGKLWAPGFDSVTPLVPWPESTNRPPGKLPSPPARGAPELVLTNIDQIRQLRPEQLVRWPKVQIRGVVTELFGTCVQDETAGVEVWFSGLPREQIPQFGSLVSIEGRGDYAVGHGPIVRVETVKPLGKGKLPRPLRCSWSELASGRMVSQWIETEAVVRATDGSHLLLSAEGGQLMATIRSAPAGEVRPLVDATIRLRGVSVAASDSRGRMQGIQLLVPSLDFVEVRQPAPAPFALPRRQIGSLLQLRGPRELTHRVKIEGVLTFREGRNYFVQDASGGAMAIAQQEVVLGSRAGDWSWMFWQSSDAGAAGPQSDLGPGDQVEVVGFPEMGAYSPVLTEVLVRKVQGTNTVSPVAAKIEDILGGSLDSMLVSIEATALRQQLVGPHSVLELQSGQRVYQALFPANLAAVPDVTLGSRLRVTGVCQLEPLPYAGLGKSVGAFKLMVGSPKDLDILQQPPWWTLGRALLAAAGLLFGLALAASWIGILRRQVEQRTRELQREIAEHEKTENQLAAETRRVHAEIEERKRVEAEVEKSHKQLLLTSRMAGMAEVATSVLHNVGNVLNSANVLASLIVDQVQKSKVNSVARLAGLLREHERDLGRFIQHDNRGRELPGYVQRLAAHLGQEQERLLEKTKSLTESIQHIKEIVATQQNYARIAGALETVDLAEIVEDALRMHSGAMARHQVQVVRQFEPASPVTVERHKVLQILFNLLENAKYACDHSPLPEKQIIVKIRRADNRVQVLVIDNGVGIGPENLARIFAQDFSTRKGGHGFGLHSSLLAAQEMGGSLSAQSEGLGRGASFSLEIPIVRPDNHGARPQAKPDNQAALIQ